MSNDIKYTTTTSNELIIQDSTSNSTEELTKCTIPSNYKPYTITTTSNTVYAFPVYSITNTNPSFYNTTQRSPVDRIIHQNEKDFKCGDLVKSVDNKLGLVININSEMVKGNYKTIYFKVMFNQKFEIWAQFKDV